MTGVLACLASSMNLGLFGCWEQSLGILRAHLPCLGGSLLFQGGGRSGFLVNRPQQGGLHDIISIDGHQWGQALLELPDSSV